MTSPQTTHTTRPAPATTTASAAPATVPPPTTASVRDCLAEFLDTHSDYGWEICLYAQRYPWRTVTATEAEQIVTDVWTLGAGPAPRLDFGADECTGWAGGCSIVTADGERIIGLPADELGGYALRLLLHELAHHIVGLDHSHDMTQRCWTLVLHVMYEIPEAVAAEAEPMRLHCHDHLLSG
ncbi:hypothetical protein [Candidatus Poriferisodalis sp.]|uniref:hypothetical protein n=1 Tax=Candidatus Poriferisodalis sp. TaxID=3101277 RepID=UPI003B017207